MGDKKDIAPPKSLEFSRDFRFLRGENLRAKVEFISAKVTSEYDALKLSIINREQGMVDSKIFKELGKNYLTKTEHKILTLMRNRDILFNKQNVKRRKNQ